MRLSIYETEVYKAKLFDKDGYYIDLRIDRDSIPDGYTMYEIRYSDEDDCVASDVRDAILVNFLGTFVCKGKLNKLGDINGGDFYVFWNDSLKFPVASV